MNRQYVINAAKNWLGKNEADGSFREIIDTYNMYADSHGLYHMTYYDPWCAAFVGAVAVKAGVTDIIPVECSCDRMIQKFINLNRWMELDSYTPSVGDIIFYDWQDTGAGENIGSSDHVGIVCEVNGDDIVVIEGNSSDRVQYTRRKVNQQYIRGYGVPKYIGMIPTPDEYIGPQEDMETVTPIAVGDTVKVKGNTWYNGTLIPSWVKQDIWVVAYLSGDRAVINKNASGTKSIMSPIDVKFLEKAQTNPFEPTPSVTPNINPSGNMSEKQIWDYLMSRYVNPIGVAAIMGNLYAESSLNPKNLQDSYEQVLGFTDESYTSGVDTGMYTNFVNDSAGYGLVQWTYWSRKKGLLDYCKASNTSIGDCRMQLEYMMKELLSYQNVLGAIVHGTSIREVSDIFMVKYEAPADQSEYAKARRGSFSQTFYDRYVNSPVTPVTPGQPVEEKDPEPSVQPIIPGINPEPIIQQAIQVGETVNFLGGKHYVSSLLNLGFEAKPGLVQVTYINEGAKHPYHVQAIKGSTSTAYGWVDRNTLSKGV